MKIRIQVREATAPGRMAWFVMRQGKDVGAVRLGGLRGECFVALHFGFPGDCLTQDFGSAVRFALRGAHL